MASIVYNSFWEDLARGLIDTDTDTFKVMALGPGYSESKASHSKRSDLTNEVSGPGYTAGGTQVTVTVTRDNATNRLVIGLGGAVWANSTVSGVQKFGYYKSRGGAAGADELVALVDHGSPVSTSNGPLSIDASTITIQN